MKPEPLSHLGWVTYTTIYLMICEPMSFLKGLYIITSDSRFRM